MISVDCVSLPTLTGSAMVPDADEHGMRFPLGLEIEPRAYERPQFPISHLEVVRAIFGEQGFSKEVVELFVGAIRTNRTSAYDSAWRSW
ncbi:hypothetical protein GHT06_020210 [Daphnia sinensis]|uniref:Uncharacterized protein n=1 Tax=Daphnia sinensis TaxID=1820382 RepID=A0AAD5L441_9CRUS|nr:hypothetical protein GHT06_020210 [Daphnia sinensis]